jgi:predicted nuclease of predicted toxin-antitoxin system
VLITPDLNFGAILAVTHGDRPSVVQIREGDISQEHFGRHIIAALCQILMEPEHGALVTMETGRARIRRLPIPRT